MKIIITFTAVCLAVVMASESEDQMAADLAVDQRGWPPEGWVWSRPYRNGIPSEQAAEVEASPGLEENDLPEETNYDVDGIQEEPITISGSISGSITIPWWGRKRKRDVSVVENSIPVTLLGSKTELKLYSSKADLRVLYNTPVIRAELYERPLNSGADRSISLALGGRQSGVVVTLNDGRRFLVVKGNQMGRGSKTVAIISNHMTDDWTKVDTKVISSSTLGDFIKAGGHRFDAFKDNGRQAALRMMTLQ